MAEQVDILIVQDAGQSSQPFSKEKKPEKLAAATSSVKWREVKVQGQLDKFKDQRYLKWKNDLQMFLGMNNLLHLTQPPLNNQTPGEREKR
jgi:hypothetical protein